MNLHAQAAKWRKTLEQIKRINPDVAAKVDVALNALDNREGALEQAETNLRSLLLNIRGRVTHSPGLSD